MHVWGQLWPNLAANVLWAPAVWVSHRLLKRRMAAFHRDMTARHDQHDALIVQHVLGTPETKQEGAGS